jgi:hypothetical protein
MDKGGNPGEPNENSEMLFVRKHAYAKPIYQEHYWKVRLEIFILILFDEKE